MTEKAKELVEWLNCYIMTDPAHKVIAREVFGHNGDCGDYGEDWMWLDDICQQTADLIESLSAELEQVKRERDAAVEELKGGSFCHTCAHYGNGEYISNDCHDCINSCNWQWRGVKEE